MDIAIANIIIINITGCFVGVCSTAIVCSCMYFHKSKKNSLEFANKTHQGDETTLKIYAYTEETISKQKTNFYLGKASTLIPSFATKNLTNNKQSNQGNANIETINNNQVIMTNYAEAFTKVIVSNNTAINQQSSTSSDVYKKTTEAVINSSFTNMLIDQLENQATQTLNELESSKPAGEHSVNAGDEIA